MRIEKFGAATLFCGDSRDILSVLPLIEGPVDALVTDPPYALVATLKRFANSPRTEAAMPTAPPYRRHSAGFMGQKWDTGETAFSADFWALALQALKPGGHLTAFGGTRTYHRLACAVEDAGFEVRDTIAWIYGSGFPKSHDVSKGIDKRAGAEREVIGIKPGARYASGFSEKAKRAIGSSWQEDGQVTGFAGDPAQLTAPATPEAAEWEGWGTALKPALEPIVLARKPLAGTVVGNVLEHRTGAINIDACRVEAEGRPLRVIDPKPEANGVVYAGRREAGHGFDGGSKAVGETDLGRWPANVIHDGSDEVLEAFPDSKGQQGDVRGDEPSGVTKDIYGKFAGRVPAAARKDTGSAARFFYCAKAAKSERGEGNTHPTVKPLALMGWLCRLITPPGGIVLDPFMGSGSTGLAALTEGFGFIGIEREPDYFDIACRRFDAALKLKEAA